MIKIERLWSPLDKQFNITLLNRPRISIALDEFIWEIIEKNIVIPNKIMQSNKYDFNLIVSLKKYDSNTCRFFRQSPYNGALKENATISTYLNPNNTCERNGFIGGEDRTTWFSPEKFWTNDGNKTALISACAENVDEHMTPIEYSELLFDAYAATLLYNFKKLKKIEFDELKTRLSKEDMDSFTFPAPFNEQNYLGDDRSIVATKLSENGVEEKVIDIPNIEIFYNKYFNK